MTPSPDGGLDATDRQLLTLLQEDGRLPYSDLASATGLSSGAARARVLRLQERGILRVVGVTDPLQLGYRSMAMLTIEVEGDVEPVADAIGAIDAVIYVVVAAGPADLLVEVIAPDGKTRLASVKRARVDGLELGGMDLVGGFHPTVVLEDPFLVVSRGAKGEIDLRWISTSEQQADIFTKALSKHPFCGLRDEVMGITTR